MTTSNTIRLYKDLNLKDGTTLTKGSLVTIAPTEHDSICLIEGRYRLRYTSAVKPPSLKRLEHWAFDGVCETPLGNETEGDGNDEFGFPAWLKILGYV